MPGQNLYSLVGLQAELTPKQPVSDEAISQVNSTMRFVKVWRAHNGAVRLQMHLVLAGGVTAAWLSQSLQHWLRSWRECERQLLRAALPTKAAPDVAARRAHSLTDSESDGGAHATLGDSKRSRARIHRYSGERGRPVSQTEVAAWLAEVRELGITSIICLLSSDQLPLYDQLPAV